MIRKISAPSALASSSRPDSLSVQLILSLRCGHKLRLNLLRTLHGMHHGREVHEERIPHGFDDRTVMFRDSLANEPIMDIEQPQHAGFVGTHLATEAHNVGEHNRREFASFGCCYRCGFPRHGEIMQWDVAKCQRKKPRLRLPFRPATKNLSG